MKICVILTVCLLKCALEGTALPTPEEGENEDGDDNNEDNQEEESTDDDDTDDGGDDDDDGNENGSSENTTNQPEKTGEEIAQAPEAGPAPSGDNQAVELIVITTSAPSTPEDNRGNPPDSQNVPSITPPQSNLESTNERPVSKDSVVTTPRQVPTKQPIPHIRPTLVSTTLPSAGPESADESPLNQQGVTISQDGQRADRQEHVTQAPVPTTVATKPPQSQGTKTKAPSKPSVAQAPATGQKPAVAQVPAKGEKPAAVAPAPAAGASKTPPTTKHKDTSFREMEFSFREWTAQMKSDTADDKASVAQIKATARPQYAAAGLNKNTELPGKSTGGDEDDQGVIRRPDASARTAGSSVRAAASISPIRGGSAVRAAGSMVKQSTLPTRTGQSSVRTGVGIIRNSDAPPQRNYIPTEAPAKQQASPQVEANPNKGTEGLGTSIQAAVPNVDNKITEELSPTTKAPSAGLSSIQVTKAPVVIAKTVSPTVRSTPPPTTRIPVSTTRATVPTTRAPVTSTRAPGATRRPKTSKIPIKTTEAPVKPDIPEEPFDLPPITLQAPSAVPSSHHKRRRTTTVAPLIPSGLPNKPVVTPTKPPGTSKSKSSFGKSHSSMRTNSASIFGPGGINSFFKDTPSKRGGADTASPEAVAMTEAVPPPIEALPPTTTVAPSVKNGLSSAKTSEKASKTKEGSTKGKEGNSKTTTPAPKSAGAPAKGVTAPLKNKTGTNPNKKRKS